MSNFSFLPRLRGEDGAAPHTSPEARVEELRKSLPEVEGSAFASGTAPHTSPEVEPSAEAMQAARDIEWDANQRELTRIARFLDAFAAKRVADERARVDGILQFYLRGHTDPDSDYTKRELVSDLILEMKP